MNERMEKDIEAMKEYIDQRKEILKLQKELDEAFKQWEKGKKKIDLPKDLSSSLEKEKIINLFDELQISKKEKREMYEKWKKQWGWLNLR